VAKVAELYYTINLNIAHLGLKWMEEGRMEIFPGIQKAVVTLTDSRATNYWGIPHSWVPSQAREVKRMFRHAMFLRLWAVPNLLPFASTAVDMAGRMRPNDAAVADEKRKTNAWKRAAGPVDTSAFDGMMNGLNT
jgi:hypothetical protein